MTPDTAALRALADRADDDSSAPVVTLDTDTVRALCDAADARAALVADLRAVPGQKWESDGHWLLAEDVFALADRHAPEEES